MYPELPHKKRIDIPLPTHHVTTVWYLFWCETPASSSGKLKEQLRVTHGYPKGFASQDSYVTKLHQYTQSYPFMICVVEVDTRRQLDILQQATRPAPAA